MYLSEKNNWTEGEW